MRSRAPGKGKPGIDVLAGDDVGTQAMGEPLDGVECDQVAGVESDDVFWLSQSLQARLLEDLPFAVGAQGCSSESSLVFHDPADRGRLRACEMPRVAESLK